MGIKQVTEIGLVVLILLLALYGILKLYAYLLDREATKIEKEFEASILKMVKTLVLILTLGLYDPFDNNHTPKS